MFPRLLSPAESNALRIAGKACVNVLLSRFNPTDPRAWNNLDTLKKDFLMRFKSNNLDIELDHRMGGICYVTVTKKVLPVPVSAAAAAAFVPRDPNFTEEEAKEIASFLETYRHPDNKAKANAKSDFKRSAPSVRFAHPEEHIEEQVAQSLLQKDNGKDFIPLVFEHTSTNPKNPGLKSVKIRCNDQSTYDAVCKKLILISHFSNNLMEDKGWYLSGKEKPIPFIISVRNQTLESFLDLVRSHSPSAMVLYQSQGSTAISGDSKISVSATMATMATRPVSSNSKIVDTSATAAATATAATTATATTATATTATATTATATTATATTTTATSTPGDDAKRSTAYINHATARAPSNEASTGHRAATTPKVSAVDVKISNEVAVAQLLLPGEDCGSSILRIFEHTSENPKRLGRKSVRIQCKDVEVQLKIRSELNRLFPGQVNPSTEWVLVNSTELQTPIITVRGQTLDHFLKIVKTKSEKPAPSTAATVISRDETDGYEFLRPPREAAASATSANAMSNMSNSLLRNMSTFGTESADANKNKAPENSGNPSNPSSIPPANDGSSNNSKNKSNCVLM